MPAKKTIGVIGGRDADEWMRVLTALAHSCGLSLRHAHPDEGSSLAGFIVLGTEMEPAAEQAVKKFSSIRVLLSDATKPAVAVCFGTGPGSPLPFRGRSLLTSSAVLGTAPKIPAEVIATADGQPVWTTFSEGGLRHDTCWVSRPWIKHGECAFDHLNSNRFMNLLPLLDWLRWISDWREWQQPPLQACFLFDDPNLHSTRYGFVNYNELAVAGRRHHYHSAFATVPLDGYYVNPAAARILRDNPQTLSLLIHGNNHTYRELAGRQPPARQLAQMQQALLRIEHLEQKSSVAVSRVMAPPHGVCSAEMMEAMVEAGVEAVCVSHGSVWTGNPEAEWTVSLGTLPAMLIAGLPVIPRFGLDRKPENKVLLAAYLNQPIIPVGHHWDLAEGTDILSSAAQFINGLGAVEWTNLATITRGNYRFQVEGSLMRVRTFSRATTIEIPDVVSEMELEMPGMDLARETIECRDSNLTTAVSLVGQRFSVTPGSRVELAVQRSAVNGVAALALPWTPLNVLARKVLVELRDRSMPCVPRSWIKR